MKKWGTLFLVPLLLANPVLARDANSAGHERRCGREEALIGSEATEPANLATKKSKKCRSGAYWLAGAAAAATVGGIIAATSGGKAKSP